MRKTIKEIIEKAELQSVTMKKVIQDVFAKYPDQDLNDQRNFIKDTAKEVNSIVLSIYSLCLNLLNSFHFQVFVFQVVNQISVSSSKRIQINSPIFFFYFDFLFFFFA